MPLRSSRQSNELEPQLSHKYGKFDVKHPNNHQYQNIQSRFRYKDTHKNVEFTRHDTLRETTTINQGTSNVCSGHKCHVTQGDSFSGIAQLDAKEPSIHVPFSSQYLTHLHHTSKYRETWGSNQTNPMP